MPASLQHHRRTTGLFQHHQQRIEPPLQTVLHHLAQRPGDADKYRRAVGYLSLIGIITHIGAVTALPDRPPAHTGSRAAEPLPAAGGCGNATVDAAGACAGMNSRMTGLRGLPAKGGAPSLTADAELRYETSQALRAAANPDSTQDLPLGRQQTRQNGPRQEARHRRRHAAHRARKQKTTSAADVANRTAIASARNAGALHPHTTVVEPVRAPAAKRPHRSVVAPAVQSYADSSRQPAAQPDGAAAANVSSRAHHHPKNPRNRRHAARRDNRLLTQPPDLSPHRPTEPSLGLAPDERIIRASDFLGGGELNALTHPQPAVLHSHYATSGEAKEYVRLEIQPTVATSTALSTCLLSQDRHACGIATATAVGYLFCGYSLRLLHEYVAAAWHGIPARPPSAHYPPTSDETLSRPTLSAIAEMTGSEAQAAAKAELSAKALSPAATQVATGTKSEASAALPTSGKAAVVTLSPPDWAVPVDKGGMATREATITPATAAPDPLHTGTTALAGTTFGTITPTSSTAHPPAPTGTETIPPLMLHYSHIHYDNFIGNEHWLAMNDVLTRAMTKGFYQHFFDPLLRDIAFERDSGQGIPLPILLENVQRRLAEAKAALAQHSVLINIGVMEGYARQITQIQQTLAETFPTASVVTGATAADVIAASAHHSANRPYSLAELLQRRVAIQPLKQALKDRFLHRFGPAEAPLPSLPPRFRALWAAASGLVEHAIVNKDVQNYILLDERAGDYFARYMSSLYQQWLDELYHGDPGPNVLAYGKPIFNELFLSSSYFGYYGADQQQSLNETFTTLVAYYHLLPALARWQNNVRLDQPTIPFTVLNEIQTALLAIPATPEQQ